MFLLDFQLFHKRKMEIKIVNKDKYSSINEGFNNKINNDAIILTTILN